MVSINNRVFEVTYPLGIGILAIPPTNVKRLAWGAVRSLGEKIAHFGSVLLVIQCINVH